MEYYNNMNFQMPINDIINSYQEPSYNNMANNYYNIGGGGYYTNNSQIYNPYQRYLMLEQQRIAEQNSRNNQLAHQKIMITYSLLSKGIKPTEELVIQELKKMQEQNVSYVDQEAMEIYELENIMNTPGVNPSVYINAQASRAIELQETFNDKDTLYDYLDFEMECNAKEVKSKLRQQSHDLSLLYNKDNYTSIFNNGFQQNSTIQYDTSDISDLSVTLPISLQTNYASRRKAFLDAILNSADEVNYNG